MKADTKINETLMGNTDILYIVCAGDRFSDILGVARTDTEEVVVLVKANSHEHVLGVYQNWSKARAMMLKDPVNRYVHRARWISMEALDNCKVFKSKVR